MPQDDEKKQEHSSDMMEMNQVSVFHNALELDAKIKREEELKERQRQAEETERAYQEREAYAKELAEEKVDLMRLKQGVISDSSKVFREQEEAKKYTIWQKIGNWFYHAKWWLGIAVFCGLVTAFLIYDYATRENPDFRMLVLSEHAAMESDIPNLTAVLDTLIEDYNQDKEVKSGVIYIPVSKRTMEESGNYSAAYNTQLLIQFQTSTCMLVMADDAAEAYLQPEDMFVSLEALYPECEFAEDYKLKLDGTNFAEWIGMSEELNPGSYLALRIPAENMDSLENSEAAYANAKEVLDQIVPILERKENAGA
ncbi:MAG: hypothetical protein MJ071_05565 [Oscillospiraceae bacterium]|nr:hypothetical protein [Oscillospiraceae bacterium]